MGRQLSLGSRRACKLDLDRVIFEGDRDLQQALTRDKRFARILVARDADAASMSARRRLLLNALRLSPSMAKEPFAALADVNQTLGLEGPLELYCVSESRINAFVVPPRQADGVLLVGFTSEALERLDPAELRFVLGHELGHVLFGHFNLSVSDLVGDEEVAPIQLVRLCAWMRYAELSADRVGLLCCDDFDAAVRAFFKLTSGLSQPAYLNHAREHAEQLAAVASDEIESSEADWLSTHPYSPLRVKALDLFARSDAFHGIMGRSPAEARFHRFLGKSGVLLAKAELEREVGSLMRMMDPSFLSDELDVAVATRELLALAGMAIALADGQVTRGEREALGSLVGKRGVVDSAADLLALSPEDHDARMASLAQSLSSHLSPLGRKRLVEDLIVVALADRHLARAELDVAMKVAARLGVSPEDVERTVGRVLGQLD